MDSKEEVTNSKEEMQQEIDALQKEINSSKQAMHRTQVCFHEHQAKSNYLTTSLQAQLRHKDRYIQQLRKHQDRQIESIVSHLLFLEGQIRKDQKQYLDLLIEKERKIKDQQTEIDELKDRNNNLVTALKELHVKSGSNGFNHENGQEKLQEQAYGNGAHQVQLRTPKDKDKAHKLKFSGMRERLRRHRSSFELHHPEPLETLEETTFRSSSQENLTDDAMDVKERRMNMPCKERPRSMIEMPSRSSEYPLLEFPQEVELNPEYDDEVYEKTEDDDIFANGCDEPADITKSYSMPQDISRIANGLPEEIKERPHSMSSVELLAAESAAKSTPSHTQHKQHKHHKQHQQQQHTTPQKQQHSPSEGNPFKSIKTMLKRKGSKLRNKKRSVSLPQGTNQEYAEALKKHFEKYDLS